MQRGAEVAETGVVCALWRPCSGEGPAGWGQWELPEGLGAGGLQDGPPLEAELLSGRQWENGKFYKNHINKKYMCLLPKPWAIPRNITTEAL